MKQKKLTAVRKALLWWFRWPANPYICVSFAVDFSAARAYLRTLAAEQDRPISVHHLLLATVGRLLEEFPQANARLRGHRLVGRRKTGVAMPVDLMGREAGHGQEVAMALLDDTRGLSLRAIAERSRDVVGAERAGRSRLGWVRALTRLIDQTPYPVLAQGLTWFDRLTKVPAVGELFYGDLPGTGLTNVGAAFGQLEGMMFRGGSLAIPQRLMHAGSVWGISALQDEVIPVDGQPCVRPMLPVVLCFDHRLFDGVMAGKLLVRFGEILLHPEAEFGADADRVAPPGPGATK